MNRVYVKGVNIMRQLGKQNQKLFLDEYTCIPELEGRKVRWMDGGMFQSYFALDDGQILYMGYPMFAYPTGKVLWYYMKAPRLFQKWQKYTKVMGSTLSFNNYFDELTSLNHNEVLKNQSLNIAKHVSGNCNLLYIHNGNVYSMGQNSHGQLGHGSVTYKKFFEKVVFPVEEEIVDISSGFSHTLFVTQKGKVFGCGKTSRSRIIESQLVEEKQKLVKEYLTAPVLISQEAPFIKSAAGMSHSIFLSSTNRLYGLGWNQYGQCGQSILKTKELKQLTEIFCFFSKNERIKDIKCGFHHTLIMTDKRVYFMGSSVNNEFPFKQSYQDDAICSPKVVPIEGVPLKIFAKYDRSAILTEDGVVYTFGGDKFGGRTGELEVFKNPEINPDTEVGLGYGHTLISV